MKNSMKFIVGMFVVILMISNVQLLRAQQATERGVAKISGKVIEKKSGNPIPYASVALVGAEDKKTIAGAVADLNGDFTITGVPLGKFLLQTSYLGFSALESNPITVDGSQSVLQLGQIGLEEVSVNLKEVTVQGQRSLIEERVDRTIYNAENDRTTIGGDATDVLRRVPMLSVDLDGNVSMRGSSNILVLINGRQSAIVASNIADALKQIPAEEIKSVEVITSPSAKYDAEGTGGVINIITKKNNLKGASLNLNSSAGLRGSNLGLNASLKQGKMSWTLGGFGRSGYNIKGSFENLQTLKEMDGSTTATISQSAQTRNRMMFGRYNLGWDYEIDKKNFMTASVSFGLRDMVNKQDGLLTETAFANGLSNSVLRDVQVFNLSNNVDFNYNYTRNFNKPQQEFSISALYSRNNRTNDFLNNIYNSNFSEVMRRIKNENRGINEEFTVQLDYVTPLGKGKNKILEYGAKNINRLVTSDFAYFTADGASGPFRPLGDSNLSNEFIYKQNVSSAYSSYTMSLPNSFSFKAGLRYEYTKIDADFRNSEPGLNVEIPSYGTLIPSLNLSKRLDNGNTIKTAYNRRIQRPSIQFLNPNIEAANPLQISQGNPILDPELTDNYELSYSTFIKGSSLNFTSFFRNTTGSIQPVRTVQGNDVIFTTFENIGTEKALGLNLNANIILSGKFSLNTGLDSYYAMLDNGLNGIYAASNTGFVLGGRLFANYSLPKDWQLQGFSFARGRQVQLQGTSGGFGVYGLNLNKQFNEKKGSIGFGAENFVTREFKIRNELSTPFINQQSIVGLKNMNFKINFTYRIGKLGMESPSRRRRRGVTNEDLKEGGEGGAGAVINN
jgi:outer membrane receptor protein involved in Fe transport